VDSKVVNYITTGQEGRGESHGSELVERSERRRRELQTSIDQLDLSTEDIGS